MIDLDRIEQVAKAAQEADAHVAGSWKLIADFARDITPDVVLALVARIRALESATRYLWNSWARAEGDGQPQGWVFGPDPEMRKYLVEMEESFHEAPAEIQAAIRVVIGR